MLYIHTTTYIVIESEFGSNTLLELSVWKMWCNPFDESLDKFLREF